MPTSPRLRLLYRLFSIHCLGSEHAFPGFAGLDSADLVSVPAFAGL